MAHPSRLLYVFAWAVLALAVPASAQQAQGKFDQEFQNGLGNFTVTSRRTSSSGGVTDQVLHNGKKVVELIGNASPDVVTALELNRPAFRLLAGQSYTLSLAVKTESAAGGVALKVTMPEGIKIEGLKEERLGGTNDWKELKQAFTVSKDSQPASIALELTGPGKVWADDFKISGLVGQEWSRRITIDPNDVAGGLTANKLDTGAYVDYHTGRWPYISFIGGMVMGNRSDQLEFFYTDPNWKWSWRVLDYVLTDGGKVFGLRAKVHRYKEGSLSGGAGPKPMQSFLLTIRTDVLLSEYYPSYIYANGRRIWDRKKHKLGTGNIVVPFSIEGAEEPVIDMVVDKDYTPESKGLALRMFFLSYIGEAGAGAKTGTPGLKVDLADTEEKPSGSPADKLEKFVFGLFPSGYEFWGNNGPKVADIKRDWKPNFRPEYPTDDIFLSPFIMSAPAGGKYYDFMMTYGGCNLAGVGTTQQDLDKNPYIRAVLYGGKSPDARNLLNDNPNLQIHWMRGELGSTTGDKDLYAQARENSGAPKRFKVAYEPFPPSLGRFSEYERGVDYLILKNEEDPSYNLLMSMSRGIGRSYGQPFGFYWEQTHYPYPSAEEKLHCCMLYYLSGGSWIAAEADAAPSFANDIVADWVFPYVQALRFAMVHPARGTSIVPIGVVYSKGDGWCIPYNPFGLMDTFHRFVEYDNSQKKLICEPAFTQWFDWMPKDAKARENWKLTGHTGAFITKLDELKGYDLLDAFFPKFGDAYTARIARLLTGTPYGPVDFVVLEQASAEHLKSFGVLAFLGKGSVRLDTEAKVTEAAKAGSQVIIGAQHFPMTAGNVNTKPFGLTFEKGARKAEGVVTGLKEILGEKAGQFSGDLFTAAGAGWETVASVDGKPLIIRKPFEKGMVYVYLGRWVHQGADALRPVLTYASQQAAPLKFSQVDDQLEYVAYKKGAGAWVALFNHGGITVGCDRLDPSKWRVQPPEPLFLAPKGAYTGSIEFRLDKLGLDPKSDYALYQVIGIDGQDFDQVIAGQKTFEVRDIPFESANGVLKATVKVEKRGQFVVAPKGQGREVFFGKP